MPIRLNLLAEAQAAEEARRKDPAKRAVLVALVLVAGAMLWSSSLQIKAAAARSQLNSLEAQWRAIDKAYQQAADQQRRLRDTEAKLAALERLHTNRFLWGNVLNALQQTLNGVDDVQVVRVRGEQTYTISQPVKATKNTPAKPATATEKIVLVIDAQDSNPQPGGAQVAKFKEAILRVPWFEAHLQKTNAVLLTSLSAPQTGAGRNPFVLFSLQCNFPETTR
jgi:predicted RNase H-like nuclease (RuvC/YqgF family)